MDTARLQTRDAPPLNRSVMAVGSIRKRVGARGVYWDLLIDVGKDSKGKRVRKTFRGFRTKREAETKRREVLSQSGKGYVDSENPAVGEYLRRWLREYAERQLRPTSYERYRDVVERHLIPGLGHLKIGSLTPPILRRFFVSGESLKNGRQLSETTLAMHYAVLRRALNTAVRWGVIAVSPLSQVDAPKEGVTDMAILDWDSINRLLGFCKVTKYYPAVLLAIYTGMRRGEILALRWRDVDLDMAELYVTENLTRVQGGVSVAEPKTAASRRAVALSPGLVIELRHLKEASESDSVCSDLTPGMITNTLPRLCKRAGVEATSLRGLRHTHASLMLQAGVHPKIVQERLGHSSISITLDIYSHVVPGMQAEAARRFESHGVKLESDSRSHVP